MKRRTDSILIVDDEIAGLRLLTDILNNAGYRVRPTERPQSAIKSAMADPPDLILLDVRMPEMDGFEVCRRLKQDERTRTIPIIFISALQDTQDRVQGFEVGGVDFVSKPFQGAEVLARVNTHLQLHRMQLHLEELVAGRTSELARTNEALGAEIAERKQLQEERDRILNLSYDLICVAGMDGYFKYLNPAWEHILGYTRQELFASPFLDFIHPDDQAGTDAEVEHLAIGHQTIDFDNRYLHKDGSIRHLSWRVTPLPEEKMMYCIARDVTERKQTEQQLQVYQQRLKALSTQLTLVEEQERRRIAGDLHDHIGHALALAHMQLHVVLDVTSQIETRGMLDDICNILLQAIQDTKTLMFELSVPTMNEIGLAAAISEWLEESVERRYGLEIDLSDRSSDRVLDADLRAILFRNVRELFTNVIKHAQAKKVMVSLDDLDECVRIRVKDDGLGFDPESASQKATPEGGFGLFSIQERLSDLGGSLEILSKPGQGCEVIMTAPFERSKKEVL